MDEEQKAADRSLSHNNVLRADAYGNYLAEEGLIMMNTLHFMVMLCGDCRDPDPFTRNGTPQVLHQTMFAELGAIDLTIKWIRMILAGVEGNEWLLIPQTRVWDPENTMKKSADNDPVVVNCGHHICAALLLAFRFLRQVIRD